MKRILTLYFTYKGFSDSSNEYVPFTTTVIDGNDENEYLFTQKWLANILDARLKCDSDISSFVITETEETDEETEKLEEQYAEHVGQNTVNIPQPKGNVITLDFGKKDGPNDTKDN